ncbi:RimK family alpha-L-glutamate ligase [Kitasatospora sp. MMS16-BH015]|uniref:RimK family alpha-L-glutamate ligase n=1 Tax=Kitasatospora sp. MMS16-BH015 TaxID=2018025 RepID=UPI00131A5DE8|nr:RimK family alpha-L-glutamate ligase [Kitasatospora sp. MMS16-BH015]
MPTRREADLWLLLGAGLSGPFTRRITAALAGEFGDRFAVVRSAELVMGAGRGGLSLHGSDGGEVTAPQVVYGRVRTPGAGAGREIALLRHLESMGSLVLNPADAVLACQDKFWQLQRLVAAGLAVPESRMGGGTPLHEVTAASLGTPCVVKAVRGHRGEQVFLAPDPAALRALHGRFGEDTASLLQEYIGHSHGRDLRVVVVDGHAAAAGVRTAAEGEFRSNLALGGTLAPCPGRYPEGEELAVRAAAAMGLAVAGVDLLFAPGGGFVVCEVNANVSCRPELAGVPAALVAAFRARLRSTGGPLPASRRPEEPVRAHPTSAES